MISPKKIKIGDGVKVLSMNLKGTVSTLPNAKGDLYVQMGILRSLVNIKDLELLDEPSVSGPGLDSAKKNTGSGKIKMSKSFSVSPEINLIGMTVDEAIPVLDKYRPRHRRLKGRRPQAFKETQICPGIPPRRLRRRRHWCNNRNLQITAGKDRRFIHG